MRARRRAHRERKGRKGAAVDIIPLIDVMFLLLSFFIFVTMSMVLQKGIPLEMAASDTAESPPRDQQHVVITISKDGDLFLNKEKINEAALAARLQAAALEDADRPVFINADANALHQWVIRAMDIVRKSRLTQIVFMTEPET